MKHFPTNRLEAFSDGVIAIIITVMVLELRAPEGINLTALKPLVPVLFSYVLSFIYLAIYWNNHHHLLHAAGKINGRIMWLNFHLLFWLSLFPFVTAWVGRTKGAAWPTALYGFVFFMAAMAYFLLQNGLIDAQGKNSTLSTALKHDWKGKLSPVCYLLAIAMAFVSPWISNALFIVVALIWCVPDARIEKLAE